MVFPSSEHLFQNLLIATASKKEQCVNFLDLFYYVHKHGRHTVNRKGQGLYEMRNVTLVLDPEASPYCFGRYPSQEYLEKELAFYASGSLKLSDALMNVVKEIQEVYALLFLNFKDSE